MRPDHPDPHDGATTSSGRRRLELWRHSVHVMTAHLMLDIRERRLCTPSNRELDRIFATSIVATDEHMRVLAATVGRHRFEAVAVSALDRGVAALARTRPDRPSEIWKITDEPIIVSTDARPPFSSHRFLRAVAELGCEHRVRQP